MKYRVINDREFIRLLHLNGYAKARSNGDHIIYYNKENHDSITINRHLNPMVMRRLIKEHNLKIS